ncbi:MAG: hypothetical protein ACLQUY_26795 [Ktedonobacterales bacterium]
MNRQSRATTTDERVVASNHVEMQLPGGTERDPGGIPLQQWYQRVIARGLWLAIAAAAIFLFIAAMPFHAEHLHVLCQSILCNSSQTPSQVSHELHKVGLTSGFFTTYTIVIESIFGLAYLGIAALIFWRKSDDLMALLVAAFLITFVLSVIDISQVLEQSSAWLRWLAAGMGFLGEMTFPLCFYLFPNGRFVPRWTRWLLPSWFLWGISEYLLPGYAFHSTGWFSLLEGLAFAAGLGSIVVSQIYRYRFVSSPAQRQQTKWVVFGMVPALVGFFCAGFVGFVVPNMLLPAHSQPSSTLPVVLSIIANGSIYLLLLLIPLSLAIAILRYRLWEIDAIVNKALVAGLLSVLLAAIYAGLIIGLESLVGLFAAHIAQPIVIVVSTLAIAALFQPFRRRIQEIIDRSFYRSKYDAARTLEEFSARLGNEVNLSQVREHLLSVVQETMQPTYVALWLRSDDQPKRADAEASRGSSLMSGSKGLTDSFEI